MRVFVSLLLFHTILMDAAKEVGLGASSSFPVEDEVSSHVPPRMDETDYTDSSLQLQCSAKARGDGCLLPRSPLTAAPQRRAKVLAIAGCTNAGKSTMAKMMIKMFGDEGIRAAMVSQDDFFLPPEQVEKVYRSIDSDPEWYYNYDSPTALDARAIVRAVSKATEEYDYVVLEGNMITEMPLVMEVVDRVLFLSLDQITCKRRRESRTYDPADEKGYFDEIVWPSYITHLRNAMAVAREDKRITFLDVSSDHDDISEKEMTELIQSFSDDILRITFDPLDLNEVMTLIGSPSCGATSIFVGTTRDTFKDRDVVRLDYESYDEMAYKELRRLCTLVRDQFPTVERVVIFHRIGEVPVGESSVIIATASPHRGDAIHATELAIDELKRTVPIWKKEVYADGGCSWKENGEWSSQPEPPVIRRNGESTVEKGAKKGCGHNEQEEKAFAEASQARDQNRKVLWLRHMVRQLNDL